MLALAVQQRLNGETSSAEHMRIALLEEDGAQRALMGALVDAMGHVCLAFSTLAELISAMRYDTFDLVVLDADGARRSGRNAVDELRAERDSRVPLMCITSVTDEDETVRLLNAGADDCLLRPVRMAELMARIAALLRRSYPHLSNGRIQVGDYLLDARTTKVVMRGKVVELRNKEFLLAFQLFCHRDQLLSRRYLIQAIWGRHADPDSRSLDTHISRVRSALELHPENGFRLNSIYNHGYRLEVLAVPGVN